MKKTTNINLAGRVFTIDDDAYELLNDYLQTLSHVFNRPDNQEITADIEDRISEIFYSQQETGKAVVTIADVESVISRIGHPEEILDMEYSQAETIQGGEERIRIAVEESDSSQVPPPFDDTRSTIKKRLFRDSKNGMIGGVCAGVAEYLHVDVTWVRLIAVGLCFISLSTFALAYLILWIILPDAVTPLQQMQLSGESPTLNNIGESVKQFYNKARSTTDAPATDARMSESTSNGRFIDGLASFFGIVAKVLIFLILVVCVIIETALGLGLIGCVLSMIIFLAAAAAAAIMGGQGLTAMFSVDDITIMGEMAPAQMYTSLICAIGYILVIAIPLFFLIRFLIAAERKNSDRKPLSKSVKLGAIITWIIAFIAAGVTTGLLTTYFPN